MAAPASAEAADEEGAAAGLQRAADGLRLLLGRSAAPGESRGRRGRPAVSLAFRAAPSTGVSLLSAGPLPAPSPESLRLGLAALEERLARDPQWAALRRARAEVARQAPGLSPGPDPPWAGACQALLLLLCLQRCLARLAAATPVAGRGQPGLPPPLRPDALSIAQEGTVQAAVQLAVALGLRPYLLPGVAPPPRDKAGLLAAQPEAPRRLLAACSALREAAEHPELGRLILARHLGDLLAGLCQLAFCPARKARAGAESQGLTEEERSSCKEALQGLLDKVYQPLVVRELLLLQGGPKRASHPSQKNSRPCMAPAPAWLQRLCGHLLSGRLLRPGGVQAVIRGILEGAGAGAVGGSGAEAAAADWQKCEAIAKILSSCPQQSLSLEDYCQQICPQILQLFLIQDELTVRQFQRVATTTVLAVVRQHPQQAEKHLLRPLLEPLLRCLGEPEGSLEDLPAGAVLVKEELLSGCMETVHKVCVIGNEPSPCLLGALQPVLGAIFSLWCFTKQNVSFLRTPCQEVLLWFLEKSEQQASVAALEGLVELRGSPRLPHPRCRFQVGSEGGVVATIKEAVSDEDEALYQKLSSEQWQLEQLVDLLSHCQRGGLAGDFFLGCLKELTQVASEKDPAPPLQAPPLDLEQLCNPAPPQQTRQLQVLQVVAMLTEGISDSLLSDVRQVVAFVAVTLQRACVGLSGGSVGTVESQTLSMAMGLVAALLGGALQLKSEDFASLKQLVPLLEELSHVHPEPVIQELAADLSISICTHHAFSAEAVCTAACKTLGRRAGGSAAASTGVPDEAPRPGAPLPQKSPRSSPGEPQGAESVAKESSAPCTPSSLQELLSGAYSPDIPTRAAALRHLSRMVEQRDPGALKTREKLLKVFVENLEHKDSFVYLSAIQGVALLSDAFPQDVLPLLLTQYASAPMAETRMKVGEALLRTTRALGDLVFQHRDTLIHAFLRGVRDPDGSLRASSLSNLGELCQILGFQLGSVVHELASCLAAVVKTDHEAEVRRAGVHVVVLLLRGLSTKAVEVLHDVLLDLYRLLKFVVRCEQDEVTVLHAQLALEELDGLLRQLLFPPQTLQKKIEILP
ncbi:transport and Golgi organization protein 6 homolog [Protobothrops mucrosquamatus]|uniref:transport and Golgi organization protein 6 homolog n=1 Tax=Protobothrops mucrosquamatus TaxID=103944 RepID=UPI0010FBA50B|nr:transport and Golgi organization protein 6 homolog [Protobothrops mucrosquamatus]